MHGTTNLDVNVDGEGRVILVRARWVGLRFMTQDIVLDLLGTLPSKKLINKKIDNEDVSFSVGDAVKHPMFGTGKVTSIQKNGDDLKLVILFGNTYKTVVAKMAGIEKVFSKR